jgi:hypothetical protein
MPKMKPAFLPLVPRNQTVVLSIEMPAMSTSSDSEAYYFEHQVNVGEIFYSEGIFYVSCCPLQAKRLISNIT